MTRIYLMEHLEIKADPADFQIINCLNCFGFLSAWCWPILCALKLAVKFFQLDEIIEGIDICCIQSIAVYSLVGCISVQIKHQLEDAELLETMNTKNKSRGQVELSIEKAVDSNHEVTTGTSTGAPKLMAMDDVYRKTQDELPNVTNPIQKKT